MCWYLCTNLLSDVCRWKIKTKHLIHNLCKWRYMLILSDVHLSPVELKKNKSDCRFVCLLLSNYPCSFYLYHHVSQHIHATVVWVRKYSQWNGCVYTCGLSLHTKWPKPSNSRVHERGFDFQYFAELYMCSPTFRDVSVCLSVGNIVKCKTNDYKSLRSGELHECHTIHHL